MTTAEWMEVRHCAEHCGEHCAAAIVHSLGVP